MKNIRLTLALCFALAACSSQQGPTVTLINPNGEKTNIAIEIARTPDQLARGLMNRTELAENHGMLFVFDSNHTRSFWMKNTLIPLDILYFNDAREFVSATSMVPCTQDPCTLYSSEAPAMYALEVPAGFIEEHHPTLGWTMEVKE